MPPPATYDAVQLLVAAVRQAGLNRARIGDALRDLSPWDGVAGTVRWDTLGGNTRPAHLGTVAGWPPRTPRRIAWHGGSMTVSMQRV